MGFALLDHLPNPITSNSQFNPLMASIKGLIGFLCVGGQEEGGGGVESSSRPRKAQAVDDPEGRMPGQLPTAEALPKDYTQRKSDAVSLVKSMLGREVVIKHKSKSMTWVVVEPFDVEENNNNNFAPELVGLKKFKSTDYPKETAIAELFLHLAFVY